MSEPEIIAVIRTVTVPVYIVLIMAIALRQLDRVMRHRLMHREPPEVLVRDVVLFWSLVVLIVAPAIAGAFGQTLGDNLVWVVFSTVVALGALGIFAWYEFFRIGKK